MEEKKELLDQDERVVEIELERLRGICKPSIQGSGGQSDD